MTAIIGQIKTFFQGFNGILVEKKDYLVDDELRGMNAEFLNNIKMLHADSDRKAFNKDLNNISKDISVSIMKYKAQKQKNGEEESNC